MIYCHLSASDLARLCTFSLVHAYRQHAIGLPCCLPCLQATGHPAVKFVEPGPCTAPRALTCSSTRPAQLLLRSGPRPSPHQARLTPRSPAIPALEPYLPRQGTETVRAPAHSLPTELRNQWGPTAGPLGPGSGWPPPTSTTGLHRPGQAAWTGYEYGDGVGAHCYGRH